MLICNRRISYFITVLVLAAVLVTSTWQELIPIPEAETTFQSARAYEDIQTQLSFGDRHPGTKGHGLTQIWLEEILQQNGWSVSLHNIDSFHPPITNIIGQRSSGNKYWVLLGAHYDTRQFADEESAKEDQLMSVPGANDGASGVAVLTELARSLPVNLSCDLSLVFFDAEDQGGINERNWSEGAAAYVNTLGKKPDAVIIIDMVGDVDLTIYYERNSDPSLSKEIWSQAANLGFSDSFVPQPKYSMIDDHIPFIEADIPAALIIDFDYEYWHTTHDTIDQISEQSLQKVGATMNQWITTNPMCNNGELAGN